MGNRSITVNHGGTTYFGEVATIKTTALGYKGHGIFSAYLTCEWPGSGIAVGGFSLDTPDGTGGREGTGFGLDHVIRIMETVGVSQWEKLAGRQVIVLFPEAGTWGSSAVGIASLTDDKVLIFREHADLWRARRA